jgi:hypothetical protein
MIKSMHGKCLGLAVLLACLSFEAAYSDFVLVEDFEGLIPGPIDDQHGWFAAHDTSVVTDDPAGGDNQVLAVTTDSTRLYREARIPDGTVRMFFLRIRFADLQNYSFGMSDRLTPDQFHDFEPELSMTNASYDLRINDDGTYDVLDTLTPNTWYNVWMLIDNATDDTQVYLHNRPGQPATPEDLLDAEGQTVFDFRSGSAGDLVNFYIKTGGGSGSGGPFYIDDMYLEDSDGLNLDNPVGFIVGDIDGDGDVDLADLATLLAAYESCAGDPGYNPAADLDGSGCVDLADLAALLAHYGEGT